jgi:hypothetical protein
MDRDDVGMIEGGDRLGLALEPLAVDRIGREDRRQHFQCDAAVQARVFGDEYFAHSPFAERLDDAVVPDGVPWLHVWLRRFYLR